MFRKHGVQEIAINIRKSHFEDYSWWLRRWQNDLGGVWVNIMMEEEPMGTIGYWAHHLHTWTGNEPFFLTNGDELKDIDLSAMAEQHHKSGAKATIAAVEVSNPSEYGVMVFDGNRVEKFLEKPKDPPSNFISSGLYLLSPEIRLNLLPAVENGEKFLMIEKDLFPKLAESKDLYAFKSDGKWFDCGNLERWEKAIKEWDQK
jgi:NDP-sugar pyrophosphorylase family protein